MIHAVPRLLSLATVFLAFSAHAAEPSGEYLRDWLLLGPIALGGNVDADSAHLDGFETDHLAAIGGEAEAAPAEGQVVDVAGQSLAWQRVNSEEDIIDFDAAVSKQDVVCAYAYTEVEVAAETLALCALGTNDGGRLWVNGEQVFDYPGGRGLKLDDDVFPVILAAGKNRVLLKVEERGNQWQFALRFLPFDIANLDPPLRLFDLDYHKNGAPTLRFRHGERVSKALLHEATLTVTREGAMAPLWVGDWNARYRMPLPLEATQYDHFTLEIAATFLDGALHEETLHFSMGQPVDYTLFAGGASDYVIALPEGASEDLQWAAKELQHWLVEAGAPELPITTTATFAPHAIALAPAGQEIPRVKSEPLPPQAFRVHNVGEVILFTGGDDAGLIYGVMTFLEKEWGLRWYTPAVTAVPKRESYTFRRLGMEDQPQVRVRNDFYYEAFDPIWAARNRCNGAMTYREQPGGVEAYWSVHTFYPMMPPTEFFETHPEYYSLIDGERQWDHAQLCLTNPDVLDIITERLRQQMRAEPQYLIYSVSQNDWRNPCQCENCQAIVAQEGSEAGPVVWFVNQVAERVEEEFPDKFVGTLAYQYTRKPTKTIKPRENVVIRLCSIECCFAHDFGGCEQNAEFLDDLQKWAAIAPHLYIWDYVVNFSHYVMPYPNFPVLGPNIQYFRDNKAIGIMEQAAYQSRGGEFAELRAWVIAKLLWNPEMDLDGLVDDFMYGYYGRAGQHVRAYYDLVHAQVRPDTHFGLGMQPNDLLYSDAFVYEASRLFDAAETVAEGEEVRRRVEMARLPILYLECLRQPEQAVINGSYDRFRVIADREQVLNYAESGVPHREAFHARMEAVRARLEQSR
jgi:hypothetical protein